MLLISKQNLTAVAPLVVSHAAMGPVQGTRSIVSESQELTREVAGTGCRKKAPKVRTPVFKDMAAKKPQSAAISTINAFTQLEKSLAPACHGFHNFFKTLNMNT